MSDRIHSLTVVLDANYRDDDIQAMCDAITLLRGVVSVGKNIADPVAYAAQSRARHELREKLWTALEEKEPPR